MLEPQIAGGYDIVLIPTAEPAFDHRDFCSAILARALQRGKLFTGPLPDFPSGLQPNRHLTSRVRGAR